MSLLLFDSPSAEVPYRTIQLDPVQHCTGDIWHVWIEGLGQDTIYAWCVDGPYKPELGLRLCMRTFDETTPGSFEHAVRLAGHRSGDDF
ncbi:hypothetical protein [Nitrosomonas sp.]|uniref:hypothetical protein n=1 Tax=Nitrosomonas sp. TaxID=42353 RepID=UPI003450CF69